MLVTDRTRIRASILDTIDAAIRGGVDVIQIREKDLSSPELLLLAREIVKLAAGRAAIVVNSDIAVAERLGVGFHQTDTGSGPDPTLRDRLAPETLVGASIHSPETCSAPWLDYLLLGHVFASTSKPGNPPIGVDAIRLATRYSTVPIWAIGGVTAENAAAVIGAGAAGVAVMGAILDAHDPYDAAAHLRTVIDGEARLRSKGASNGARA